MKGREPPRGSMSMPTCPQIANVFRAFTILSASCDDCDTEAAIAACEDVIRASKVILAGGSSSEESGSEDGDSAPEAESSDDEDLSPSDLVADYLGHADPSQHCDGCGYSGHTNQYCPTLPEPKRRRL